MKKNLITPFGLPVAFGPFVFVSILFLPAIGWTGQPGSSQQGASEVLSNDRRRGSADQESAPVMPGLITGADYKRNKAHAWSECRDERKLIRADLLEQGYSETQIRYLLRATMFYTGHVDLTLDDGTVIRTHWRRIGFAENDMANRDKSKPIDRFDNGRAMRAETNRGGNESNADAFVAKTAAKALAMAIKAAVSGDAMGGFNTNGAKWGMQFEVIQFGTAYRAEKEHQIAFEPNARDREGRSARFMLSDQSPIVSQIKVRALDLAEVDYEKSVLSHFLGSASSQDDLAERVRDLAENNERDLGELEPQIKTLARRYYLPGAHRRDETQLKENTRALVEATRGLVGAGSIYGIGWDIHAGDTGIKGTHLAAAGLPARGRTGKEAGPDAKTAGLELRKTATGEQVAHLVDRTAKQLGLNLDRMTYAAMGFDGEVSSAFNRRMNASGAVNVGVENLWTVEGSALPRPGFVEPAYAKRADVQDIGSVRVEQWHARLWKALANKTVISEVARTSFSTVKRFYEMRADVVAANAVGGVFDREAVIKAVSAGTHQDGPKIFVSGANNGYTFDGVQALKELRDKVFAIPDFLANIGGVVISNIEAVQNRNGVQAGEDRARAHANRVQDLFFDESMELASRLNLSAFEAFQSNATDRFARRGLHLANQPVNHVERVFFSEEETMRLVEQHRKRVEGRSRGFIPILNRRELRAPPAPRSNRVRNHSRRTRPVTSFAP